MTPPARASQVVQAPPPGRRRSPSSRVFRVTLAMSEYELYCMREIASRRGLLFRVATKDGPKPQENGTGSPLLRTMSLEDIVAEYEALRASGAIRSQE
jgi:hypothetical protein